jgi:hypothetical protein
VLSASQLVTLTLASQVLCAFVLATAARQLQELLPAT